MFKMGFFAAAGPLKLFVSSHVYIYTDDVLRWFGFSFLMRE